MAVKNDVTVTIDIQRPTPKLGFGKVLILGSAATAFPYTTFYDLDAVREQFAETTEVYKAALAIFRQDNAPSEIAVMLHKTTDETLADLINKAYNYDWYFVVSTSSKVADITTIADAVEIHKSRQYLASSKNKADLATIFAKKYKRTTMFYHTEVDNYPEAALVGAVGSEEPGSVTWKFKTLKGVTALDIDTTEMHAIHALGAITYVTKAGDDQTSEGKTVSGEYIDIVHSEDYIVHSIEFAVQKLFNRAKKVGYDNSGIARIEGEVKTILRRADINGMIAHDDAGVPLYSTTFQTRSQVDPADREKRVYNGGTFSFQLAGAIHETNIKGTIII